MRVTVAPSLSRSLRLWGGIRQKVHGNTIDAIVQSRRRRAVREQVPMDSRERALLTGLVNRYGSGVPHV